MDTYQRVAEDFRFEGLRKERGGQGEGRFLETDVQNGLLIDEFSRGDRRNMETQTFQNSEVDIAMVLLGIAIAQFVDVNGEEFRLNRGHRPLRNTPEPHPVGQMVGLALNQIRGQMQFSLRPPVPGIGRDGLASITP